MICYIKQTIGSFTWTYRIQIKAWSCFPSVYTAVRRQKAIRIEKLQPTFADFFHLSIWMTLEMQKANWAVIERIAKWWWIAYRVEHIHTLVICLHGQINEWETITKASIIPYKKIFLVKERRELDRNDIFKLKFQSNLTFGDSKKELGKILCTKNFRVG